LFRNDVTLTCIYEKQIIYLNHFFMKIRFGILIVSLVFCFLAACNKDDEPTPPNPNTTFVAALTGANEVPANASPVTGTAVLTFNNNTKIFTLTVLHNVSAPTNGHIHKGAAGVNGSVVFTLPNLTSPIAYTSVALDAAQEADLKANLYYVNIHTAAFPNGEIRGQLIKQ
jgi:CHRD domain